VTKSGSSPGRERHALGAGLALACVAYAFAIHHGIGPEKVGVAVDWYEPRGFLLHWRWLSFAFASTPRLVLLLTLPVVALSLAVVATTSSAVARTVSVVAVLATALYLFYGDAAAQVWEWFEWRLTLVLLLLAGWLGLALCAPLLAASWLRLRWPARLAVYLPFAFGAIAFIRNATGTDPNLRMNLSPWPAVPVFGLEAACFFVGAWLLGIAIALRGVAERREGRGGARPALIYALGILAPIGILAVGGALALFPFGVGPREYAVSAAVCVLGTGFAAGIGPRGLSRVAHERGVATAVGAALVLLPILAGQAWARVDYERTREGRAREIIDALQKAFDRDGLYPETLDELVARGDLAAIPRPAIGFAFLYDGEFTYRGFGTSFLLEFPAPRWVQCVYTPAYEDEEGDEGGGDEELEPWEKAEADAAAAAGGDAESAPGDEGLGESWSCPSKPPELW
jgi:hypothetical protein